MADIAADIGDVEGLGYLLILGAIVYVGYQIWGQAGGGWLCSSLGVGCGTATPTTGVGAVATAVGSAYGTAEEAVESSYQSVTQDLSNIVNPNYGTGVTFDTATSN